MKKVFSILLVVVMLFAMSTTVFAADEGSITIDNAVVDETYTIWQILDLESYNSATKTYVYTANPEWKTWLEGQTDYVVFDGEYVTWVEGADPAAFAKAALVHAETLSGNQGSKTATSSNLEFTGLDLGYYLVDTTFGTLCSLDTTRPTVTIKEKNEEPLIKKEVKEDSKAGSTDEFGAVNDDDMLKTVYFKTTVTAKEGAEAYIVHDILSPGLDLIDDSISIEGLTEGTDYTVKFDQPCTGKNGTAAECDFHIIFTQAYLDTLEDNDEIVITYSATLNSGAVVGLPGNPNDTRLQYSSDHWTEWSQTVTYTWDMEVLKYGDGDTNKVLSGAKFVILNQEGTQVAKFVDGNFAGWENRPAAGTPWPANTELVTGNDGKISVKGLDADDYKLHETKAPDGYNRLTNDHEFSIEPTKGEGNTLTYQTTVEKINNQSGTILPETGASGTVMFVTIGSLVALMAVVFMVTRKKMSIYEG